VLGLQVVSAVAGAVIAWPAAWIVFRWAMSLGISPDRSARAGWVAALLWLVVPVSWVTGSQIVSDSLGLLLGVAILALCVMGERSDSHRAWIAAAVLGGLIPGVRLVNVTMLGPLLWKCWSGRRERWGGVPVGVVLGAAFLAGAIPWIAGLALTDAAGYIQAGRSHLMGHFTNFGESVWTDRRPVQRLWTALHTMVVYGLGAGGPGLGWTRVLAGLAWTGTLAAAATLRPWRGGVFRLVAWWAVPNLLYVFLGHDVAYPRYMLTAALLATMWAALGAAHSKPATQVALASTVLSVAAVTVPVAIHQGRQPPVEYQAALYLAREAPGSIVLMTRPDILLAMYLSEFEDSITPVVMPSWTISNWRLNGGGKGRRAYLTAIPPEDSAAWVPVAHFCRDPMIEPLIAAELWLFTTGSLDPDTPLPRCAEAW
jgi:hypothetical protein